MIDQPEQESDAEFDKKTKRLAQRAEDLVLDRAKKFSRDVSLADGFSCHGFVASPATRVRTVPDPREAGCLCQGCGRRYRVDVLVPDELWEKIRPERTGHAAGGLLCGPCILDRVERLQLAALGFAAYRLETL